MSTEKGQYFSSAYIIYESCEIENRAQEIISYEIMKQAFCKFHKFHMKWPGV